MADRTSLVPGRVSDETKAKVKFDQQIIAIAKSNAADAIYSDDVGLRKKAVAVGLRAIGLEDVPLPPEDPQGKLALPEPDEPDDDDEEK